MVHLGGFFEALNEAGKLQQSNYAQPFALQQAQQNAHDWERIALRNKSYAVAAEAEADRLRQDYNRLATKYNMMCDKYDALARFAAHKGIVKLAG